MANINKDNEISDKASEQIESLLNSSDFKSKFDEFQYIFNKLLQLIKELGGWSELTAKLFGLELSRNFSVIYKILFCHILFVPLLIIFILSLCVFFGIIVYSIYSSLIISSVVFLTSLFIILSILAYWQKKLSEFLGFSETILQVKEGLDVINKATK